MSIPRTNVLAPTLENRLRGRLRQLMTDQPCQTYQIKFNHYWPQFFMQEVSAGMTAE